MSESEVILIRRLRNEGVAIVYITHRLNEVPEIADEVVVFRDGNLVASGPGEATLLTTVVSLDPIHAYFDADEQFFLKYSAHAGQRTRTGSRPSDLPIRMALASDEGFPREGRTDFLDNQLDAATGSDGWT